jgi:hypothetical protein
MHAMHEFFETLKTQRWDDHRYYHHSFINQSLHLLSAVSFLFSYVVCYWDPAIAAIVAWMVAMTSRQAGHFFFEPKGYDTVNHATHEYKEEVKVGYNLRRKVALLAVWALSPLVLYFEPSLFGLVHPHSTDAEFIHQVGLMWFVIGIGGLFFRTVQLFFVRSAMTGIAWFVKILTDPFHDIMLYHRAPIYLMQGYALAEELAEQ